jgi:hypothetical protein
MIAGVRSRSQEKGGGGGGWREGKIFAAHIVSGIVQFLQTQRYGGLQVLTEPREYRKTLWGAGSTERRSRNKCLGPRHFL